MSVVRALHAIRTGRMLIADVGRFGLALRNYPATKSNYGKVPVRWHGRRKKVYWTLTEDIEFINPPLDPVAYIARDPATELVNYPALPDPPDIVDYHFGRNMHQFRVARGLKQRQLRERIIAQLGMHVSQTSVSFWERSKTPPRGVYLNAVAQVLGVAPFVLLLNFDDCVWLQETRRYVNELTKKTCEEDAI